MGRIFRKEEDDDENEAFSRVVTTEQENKMMTTIFFEARSLFLFQFPIVLRANSSRRPEAVIVSRGRKSAEKDENHDK